MTTEEQLDWRARCIEEFGLIPVPWPDEVAIGSEETWKNYYKYRVKFITYDNYSPNEVGSDDYFVQGREEVMQDWCSELQDLWDEIVEEEDQEQITAFGDTAQGPKKKWSASLSLGQLEWSDSSYDDGSYRQIQSAKFYARIWSPYAIPHAILLQHRYHCRPLRSTVQLSMDWGYQEPSTKTICSNRYMDERLRLDVIKTSNFNKRTVDNLRFFLFGAIDQSKHEYCGDYHFLQLLFGSMGTFDFETLKNGRIGWHWSIYNDRLDENRLVEEGVLSEGDSLHISWLEYWMRKTAGNLRPIDAYYRPPKQEDALGYYSDDQHSYVASSDSVSSSDS